MKQFRQSVFHLSMVLYATLTLIACVGDDETTPTPTYTVSSNAGINGTISPSTAIVNTGASTNFTITPDAGYGIDAVSGCGGTLDGSVYTTGAVTADCTITASFIEVFTVSTSAGVNGSISPASATVNSGASTSFTLTPNTDYEIDTVSGCSGTLNGLVFTTGAVTADCTVTASFRVKTFAVSTSAGLNGNISPASATVNSSASTSFTITPDAGYGIDTVSGCGGSISGTTYTTDAITADCTVTASFIQTFTVSTSAGINGSISPTSATVNSGAGSNFTVTPDAGYGIDTVSGCSGTLSGTTYSITAVTADCTITASFIAIFTVSTSAGLNGSISPTSATVNLGESTSFTITADMGYAINSVSGCSGALLGTTYTTGLITTDCTVTASFGISAPAVSSLYPTNGANWNDYILNDGNTEFDATDSPPTGTETGGYSSLLHGGELRKVEVTGKDTCNNLTAQDDLSAFNWTCVDGTNPVMMVSTGLKVNKHLSDLIAFDLADWKDNRVVVYDNGIAYSQTPATAWWSNPVIVDNDGSDGLDMVEGDIRIISANSAATYTIGQDKVALVIDPLVVLTGSVATNESLLSASNRRYLWLEGKLDVTGDDRGIFWSSVNFSVLHNIRANNATDSGIYLSSSENNALSQIKVTNNRYGVRLSASSYNILEQITALDNGYANYGYGVSISGSNNTISQLIVSNNYYGIGFYNASNNNISQVMASNNYNGIAASGSSNSIFSQITAVNNFTGVMPGSNNTFMQITTANNYRGIYNSVSSNSTLLQVVSTNHTYGIYLDIASNFALSQITAANNTNGLWLYDVSNTIFSGQLQVGSSGQWDCFVIPGTGIDPGINSDCTQQGGSSFILKQNVTLANSFVAKVSTDDVANASDTNGGANFPVDTAAFDWTQFDNSFRSWGREGAVFPALDQRQRWETASGRIWDWSLLTTDTVIRNVLSFPTGDDTMTHTWSDATTTVFLQNALEIAGDGIGNDNLLCESNETCLYTPNMGSYQGHGALISAGTFSGGTLTGIILQRYEANGR